MIDLYYWPTPNGQKIRLFLEEVALEEVALEGAGLPYRIIPVDIGKGDQFKPEFLAISPNNKMPAIVDYEPFDHQPTKGGAPLSLFESGAILLYLARKSGRFMPVDQRAHYEVLQWLFWQVAGLGPMAGQAGHFRVYAPEPVPYGIERYTNEVARLYGVLDRRLEGREYIAGDYSIADMAIYPWIVPHRAHGQDLVDFPNIARWFASIKARPAVIKVYEEKSDG